VTIPDGIILIDKPAGITSHDVVAALRRALHIRRIGHGGTLDPGATGLLLVLVGRATRLAEYLGGGAKVYEATIRFGIATDTDDADGRVIGTGPLPRVSFAQMHASRERFLGRIGQVPPTYSAVHHQGERAYKAARSGKTLALEARTVHIEAIDLVAWNPPDLDIRVTCQSGTYIRSLARDWGGSLGSVAHLRALRRVRSGVFDVADSLTLLDAERLIVGGDLASVIRSPIPALIGALKQVAKLPPDEAERFAHGTTIERASGAVGRHVVLSSEGMFLGVADQRSDGMLVPRVVWSPA